MSTEFNRASLLYKQRCFNEALDIVNRLIELERNSEILIKYLFLKVDILMDCENYSAASFICRRILSFKISDVALSRLGLCFWKLHKYRRAIREFRYSIRINASNIISLNSLGKIYIQKGQFRAARVYFKKALIIEPRNADALLDLSIVYFRLKSWVDSYKTLNTLIRIHPENKLALKGITRIEKMFDL